MLDVREPVIVAAQKPTVAVLAVIDFPVHSAPRLEIAAILELTAQLKSNDDQARSRRQKGPDIALTRSVVRAAYQDMGSCESIHSLTDP